MPTTAAPSPSAVRERRYPERDRAMLLSVRAGLRAKEIALATWDMVTDAEGNVGDALPRLSGEAFGARASLPSNAARSACLLAQDATV